MKRIVTKEEFYKVIGPQDAIDSSIGKYPYAHEFYLRNNPYSYGRGPCIGRIEPIPEEGRDPMFWGKQYILFD